MSSAGRRRPAALRRSPPAPDRANARGVSHRLRACHSSPRAGILRNGASPTPDSPRGRTHAVGQRMAPRTDSRKETEMLKSRILLPALLSIALLASCSKQGDQ
ncbi:MAG: hypothetical protein ACRDL7_04500, partial [Gaiellaceae bacterium]